MASIAPDLPINDEAGVALGWATRLVRATGMGEARSPMGAEALNEMEVALVSHGVLTDRPREAMAA